MLAVTFGTSLPRSVVGHKLFCETFGAISGKVSLQVFNNVCPYMCVVFFLPAYPLAVLSYLFYIK